MKDISRRGFLKGTGIAAGALAITSISPIYATSSSKTTRGFGVLTAGRMGPLLCMVQGGKLVSTTNALAQTVPFTPSIR